MAPIPSVDLAVLTLVLIAIALASTVGPAWRARRATPVELLGFDP
jgi:ABC-type lipoprotein release transport system permease subunit